MKRRARLILATAAILLAGSSAASAQPPETADVMNQGGLGVASPDGARVVRQPNGLAVSVSMPAPASGSYVYPDGTTPGSPEVFTLWVFVFNHPEHCTGTCGPDDLTNSDVEFGVYNAAGHANAGSTLTLSGHIKVGDPAAAPPGITPHPLVNPAGAELHVAVTSHGALDPSTLPDEFRRLTGFPMCGCWWVSVFD